MTRREAAIVTAYTGIYMAKNFSDFHEYIEQILERPVFTHELGFKSVADEVRDKSRSDFMLLIENITEV